MTENPKQLQSEICGSDMGTILKVQESLQLLWAHSQARTHSQSLGMCPSQRAQSSLPGEGIWGTKLLLGQREEHPMVLIHVLRCPPSEWKPLEGSVGAFGAITWAPGLLLEPLLPWEAEEAEPEGRGERWCLPCDSTV